MLSVSTVEVDLLLVWGLLGLQLLRLEVLIVTYGVVDETDWYSIINS